MVSNILTTKFPYLYMCVSIYIYIYMGKVWVQYPITEPVEIIIRSSALHANDLSLSL